MSFKTAAVLVGATFLIAGASAALAKPVEHHFTGEVRKLDSITKMLVVKSQTAKSQEMSFNLASDAKVMKAGKTTSLDKLEVGQRVNVTYADQGAKHEARRIDVLASAAKARPATSAATKPKSKL